MRALDQYVTYGLNTTDVHESDHSLASDTAESPPEYMNSGAEGDEASLMGGAAVRQKKGGSLLQEGVGESRRPESHVNRHHPAGPQE